MTCRYVLSAALLVSLAACGPQRREPVTQQPRGDAQARSDSPSSSGPRHDWTAMMAKVSDVEGRQERALALLQEAVDAYEAYKKTSGAEAKELYSEADRKKTEAGSLYDVLYEDVVDAAGSGDLGAQLWKQRCQNFQIRWDRLAKKVARMNFKK